MVRIKRKRIDYRKGSGELLSFVICLPALLFLFTCIISSIQVGSIKQALDYAAYSCGRTAVVCDTLAAAETRSQLVADKIVYDSAGGIVPGSVTVTISIMDNQAWAKGNFIRCTVAADVETAAPFVSGTKTGTIVMMIERTKVTSLPGGSQE